jgi:hypothetical protein
MLQEKFVPSKRKLVTNFNNFKSLFFIGRLEKQGTVKAKKLGSLKSTINDLNREAHIGEKKISNDIFNFHRKR